MANSNPSSTSESTGVPPDELRRIEATLHNAVRAYRPAWLRDDGDDLVQKALIRLLKQYREGNPAVSSSYIWKTAYSVVVDQIRHERRKQEISLEDATEVAEVAPATVDIHGPEGAYRSTELRQVLHEGVQSLARDRRAAVTLFLQGHTVRECSEILDWGYKRTENLVYRAYADLREFLGERGFQP